MKGNLITTLGVLVGTYLFCTALLYFYADFAMYHPPLHRELGPVLNAISIPVRDGEHISAVYYPTPQAKFTLLLSHGNAEDLRTLETKIEAFKVHGYAILAYDYRGYGASNGKPSEKNTYEDIRAAYDYLIKEADVPASQIILYGFSIGTGPTVELATKVPVAGVILQSPFLSAFRVITNIPLFPIDKYNNLKKINKIKVPILMLEAENDNVVPAWHAKALYKAFKGKKQWYSVKNAGHSDLIAIAGEDYWKQLNIFCQSLKTETFYRSQSRSYS